MDLKKNIEDQYKASILNLTNEEKELYIKQLAKNYYSAFFSNDVEAFERTLANLNVLESLGIGVNTIAFIDYCLLAELHSILNKNVNSGIELKSFKIGLEKTTGQRFKDLAEKNNWHNSVINKYELMIQAGQLETENKTLQEHKEQLLKILSSKELEPSEVAIITEIESYKNLKLNFNVIEEY